MGLFFRNVNEDLRPIKVDFKIPQFLKIEGLKQPTKRSYRPTDFISPIFGLAVKDEVVAPFINKASGSIAKQFDFLRTNPMEDRSTYQEFKDVIVNLEKRKEVFGEHVYVSDRKYQKEDKKAPEITIPFKGWQKKSKFDEVITSTQEDKKVVVKTPLETVTAVETAVVDKQEREIPIIKKVDEPHHESELEASLTKLEPTFIEKEESTLTEEIIKRQPEVKKPKKARRKYTLPPYEIFSTSESKTEELPEWLTNQAEQINSTLLHFNVPGKVINIIKGPTVTRHEIELEKGINVSRVNTIKENLMMSLAAETIRIEAPIPGKHYVGIELPNTIPEIVLFGNVVNDPSFKNDFNNPLKIALGVDIDGRNIFENIKNMPHGLIAGATNSGKSVCINTIIASLLMKNHPDDLKFIMIDPKMVELSLYNDLPHLLTPVINDARTAAIALNWAVDEMERRYKLFADNRARDIKSFNEKVSSDDNLESLPCIVIIIDELADLMMASSQEVETSIQRLTAKARAAGIHLIVATQRPTTDVVKGTIKANINTRIAFRVSSYVDSITILDQAGAEQLLGKGDMLLKSVDRPMRLQGAYIKDSEIEKLTDFIKAQLEPEYLFTHDKLKERETLKKSQEKDELFFEVAKFVVEQDSCSINSIQQQFNLGFNRAQKIVESLENEEIVSVGEKNKARTVLITMSDLERFNDL
ncbi:MAG: DNA translocase FtsK [Acholeplasmatales bacterium]|jgi:S-DNA-T family DNA segregation ATPase FtsK/SpoIIIE|nr:DNA translocase FtsK [Acholeplasmataceae bacterium]MCK9289144.1 DNA translocase FtsK [Acholeplasmataceae bacterium]MCK9427092.1 DNA translocase FtsK [Acholeplasmataceae bacterium]MDY0115105.1 DNA translocase FtsK [Acholeplasmatales bacterium]HHT39554.1 DNA translocase FtsK [Acholeplasmataceae bacterium]